MPTQVMEAAKPAASFNRLQAKSLLGRFRSKQNTRAAFILTLDIALYLIFFAVIVVSHSLFVKLAASVVQGIVIARLFIIGHDACHGSFTTSKYWNKMLGRISFAPSLTTFSLWDLGHNFSHHGFTNLKGHDYVWTPLSKQEYDALPKWRQAVERVYRGFAGFGLYYLVELWWNKLIFPSSNHIGVDKRSHFWDSVLVTSYAALQALFLVGMAMVTGQSPWLLIAAGLVIPFLIWNITMGFVIYSHHTHPDVAWFEGRQNWNGARAQVENTIHVTFPLPFSALLHNIMEHTAHHVEIGIPLYELIGAQDQLEESFPADIRVHNWSWAYFRNCVKCCKLYDYQQHRWMDFDGRYTSENILYATVGAPVTRP